MCDTAFCSIAVIDRERPQAQGHCGTRLLPYQFDAAMFGAAIVADVAGNRP